MRRQEKRERELIVPRGKRFRSLEALTAACLKKVTARLWATCYWSDFTIGDYRFVVFSLAPDKESSLYVQFWSEPHEPVVCEVVSGKWNPGALKFIGTPERRAIRKLGYVAGGRAGNYGKLAVFQSMDEAERMAREVLGILFNVFGYRGQWKFEAQRVEESRADMAPVFTSVTPEDVLKLALQIGYDAHLKTKGGVPAVYIEVAGRPAVAILHQRVPDQNLYTSLALRGPLTPAPDFDDRMLLGLSDELDAARLIRTEDGSLQVAQDVHLSGGVTLRWLRQRLGLWSAIHERAEGLLRQVPAGMRETDGRVH